MKTQYLAFPRRRFTIYHSQEWMELVSQGWTTAYIEYLNGERIAIMVA